jgi:alkylhydroperoxidase/carboxymuconolactone decarboxylase family protein YurZ
VDRKASPSTGPSAQEIEDAWTYARSYYPDDSFIKELEMLGRYQPGVPVGYLKLRQGAFTTGPEAALAPKYKELLLLAMAIGANKGNPPPHGHVRLAIDAGATLQEIGEMIGLSIFYCGSLSFHETGRYILHYAEEYMAEKEAKKK